jgi:hypothetical protein
MAGINGENIVAMIALCGASHVRYGLKTTIARFARIGIVKASAWSSDNGFHYNDVKRLCINGESQKGKLREAEIRISLCRLLPPT